MCHFQQSGAPRGIKAWGTPVATSAIPRGARDCHPAFDRVNVLLCRTLRGTPQRELNETGILLDRADGLDWETLCRVDALHFVLKSGLRERRGVVCKERRRVICQRMTQLFPFEF